jgi:hypothetical protein
MAYEVLGNFYKKLSAELESLETAGNLKIKSVSGSGAFAARNGSQIKLILESLKNGIVQKNQKIPGTVSHFISEIMTNVMCRPEHWLYPAANDFFLRRPFLDVTGDIPMFGNLFYSTKPELFFRERSFALQILAAGISDGDDFQMFQKRNLFSALTSFADSG